MFSAYFCGQYIMGTTVLLTLGMMSFGGDDFFSTTTFFSDFQHPGDIQHIFALVLGGFVVSHGDFLILTACTRIPFSIAFPIHAGTVALKLMIDR
jgi:hypothetical protein